MSENVNLVHFSPYRSRDEYILYLLTEISNLKEELSRTVCERDLAIHELELLKQKKSRRTKKIDK